MGNNIRIVDMVAYYIRAKFYQISPMGLSTPGGNIALAFKNQYTKMETSITHSWHLTVLSTLVAVASLNKWKPVLAGLI